MTQATAGAPATTGNQAKAGTTEATTAGAPTTAENQGQQKQQQQQQQHEHVQQQDFSISNDASESKDTTVIQNIGNNEDLGAGEGGKDPAQSISAAKYIPMIQFSMLKSSFMTYFNLYNPYAK